MFKIQRIRRLAGVAALTLPLSIFAMGTAHADAPWLEDPSICSNIQTAPGPISVNGRTVQIRYGSCNGTQYGWGRILGYSPLDYIRFEVDITGDRVADGYSYYRAGERNYTAGYPTSSSSTRAFRACYVALPITDCGNSAAASTPWW
ncbi:hypothetical protein AB0F17_24615 [Nonomuraea sp. NPDC026600]|uniref:hypothetical protein n=1 Tax=Nonomuraea sp. NPDC026600 TaxID=3155363 RepID=UPI0033FCB716